MNYEFPIIHNISDVLPHIEDDPRFVVAKKDGYTVINYVRYDDETFVGHPIRRECRGLIFDNDTGDIISRPFHKVFNVNENDGTLAHEIDISRGHALLSKLDGSMVRPLLLNGGIRWGTKMGVTDVAMQVETYLAGPHIGNYEEFCRFSIECEYTPIFEWMSRKNRIVIDHQEEQLVLLAVRDTVTGQYLSHKLAQTVARSYNVPIVDTVDIKFDDVFDIVNTVKEMEDEEGIVLRFDDGNMLKVKSDWYLTLHRIKSNISNTRRLVSGLINDSVDDLLPLLSRDDRKEVMDFVNQFNVHIEENVEVLVKELLHVRKKGTRKDFALSDTYKEFPISRGLIFRCWDVEDDLNQTMHFNVLKAIDQHTSTGTRFERVEYLFNNLKWSGGMFG